MLPTRRNSSKRVVYCQVKRVVALAVQGLVTHRKRSRHGCCFCDAAKESRNLVATYIATDAHVNYADEKYRQLH